jgi:NADPH-dependent glutamate synthase beta subunit-like oxidoreductase
MNNCIPKYIYLIESHVKQSISGRLDIVNARSQVSESLVRFLSTASVCVAECHRVSTTDKQAVNVDRTS